MFFFGGQSSLHFASSTSPAACCSMGSCRATSMRSGATSGVTSELQMGDSEPDSFVEEFQKGFKLEIDGAWMDDG